MDAFTLISIILIIIILYIFAKGVVIIQPYQKGLAIRLGTYVGQMNPGFKWVVPFITTVIKLDLRTQVIDVPSQEVITKDNSPTDVDAIIYVRVMDPERAYFEVSNYRQATVALAQTSLRGIIGDMELDEVLYNRDMINRRLRDILDKETDQWGVKIERVEIKEVNPIGAVKQAMQVGSHDVPIDCAFRAPVRENTKRRSGLTGSLSHVNFVSFYKSALKPATAACRDAGACLLCLKHCFDRQKTKPAQRSAALCAATYPPGPPPIIARS